MTAAVTTVKGLPVSQEHQDQVRALGLQIMALLNDSTMRPAVQLDALFNVYMAAAETFGQTQAIAEFMCQVGGGLLLKNAMQQQAAGLDPFTPPTRH